MKLKKYIYCLALIFALLMQSCGLVVINSGSTESEKADTTSSFSTAAEDSGDQEEKEVIDWTKVKEKAYGELEKLPSYSFDGENITILTTDGRFFSGDGEQTVLNSDRVARIQALEKKYSFTARLKTVSKDEAFDQISANEKSGILSAHIYALPMDITALLTTEEYLKSLRSSQYFDHNGNVFNDSVSAFTAGHDVFAVSGDGCFEPEKISALYYNRSKLDELGMAYVAELVESGRWTLDKYYEYICSAQQSTFDGICSANATDNSYDDILLLSSGFNFTHNTVDEKIRLESFSENFKSLCESVGNIMKDCEMTQPDDAVNEFINGKILFLTDSVANTSKYMHMADNWSIAPHPKATEKSEYSSYISNDAIVLSIPCSIASPDGLGLLITAFNTVSKDYIKGRFIEYNMNHVVRDNGALDALGILINNENYDFAYIFSPSYPNMNKFTLSAYRSILRGDMSYEEYVDKYEEQTKEYFDAIFPIIYY